MTLTLVPMTLTLNEILALIDVYPHTNFGFNPINSLRDTVESTYKSSAYKSFSVISRVTLWTEFVPSLYVLKKRPYKSPLLPENFGYKSQLGLIVSVFTVKKRSNWLQLTVTIAPGCNIAEVRGEDTVVYSSP